MNLKDYIITIKDFPSKGIMFRDITPLLENGKAFSYTIDMMSKFIESVDCDVVVGPESRGFMFATPLAYKHKIGFVPIRKPNKLPRKTCNAEYDLEYGSNSVEIHVDSIKKGQHVVIVDDLLATGGTLKASISMIENLGGIVSGVICLIELDELNGREVLKDYNIYSLIHY